MNTKQMSINNVVLVPSLNSSGDNRTNLDKKMFDLAQSYLDFGDDTTQGNMSIRQMPDGIEPLKAVNGMRTHFTVDKNICSLDWSGLSYKIATIDVNRVIDGWFLADGKATKKIAHVVLTGNRRFYARILALACLTMAPESEAVTKRINELNKANFVVYGALTDEQALQKNLAENCLKELGDKKLDAANIALAVFAYGASLQGKGIAMKERDLASLGLKRGSQIKYFGLWRLAKALPEANILEKIKDGSIKVPAIPQQFAKSKAIELEEKLKNEYTGDDEQLIEVGRAKMSELVQGTLSELTDPKGEKNKPKMASKKAITDASNDRELTLATRQLCTSLLESDNFVTFLNTDRAKQRAISDNVALNAVSVE